MTTEQRLLRIAGKLWPDLDALDAPERKRLFGELVGILYGTLLAIFGISWLVLDTDPALVGAEWPTLVLMLILAAVLNQLDFFWVVERRAGIYDRWSSQLGGLVTISAALLFGPTALWLGTMLPLVHYAQIWRTTPLPYQRVLALRNLMLNVSSFSIGSLLGLALYQQLGGRFPSHGLAWPAVPLAAGAVLTLLAFDWLCWSCYLVIVGYTPTASPRRRTRTASCLRSSACWLRRGAVASRRRWRCRTRFWRRSIDSSATQRSSMT